MKTLSTLTALLAIGLSSQAAPIVTVTPSNVGGVDYFLFNVDPNGEVIDTIDIEFIATSGSFLNTENVPGNALFAGATTTADTDVLGLSTVATGLTFVGDEDSNTRFSAAITNLGGTISAPLDVAQVAVADAGISGGDYTFRFARLGSLVGGPESGAFGVPEPGSLALLTIGALAVTRRRR